MTMLLSSNEAASDATTYGRIAVLGLGYIGLPTAVVFALRGWDVIGVDVSDRTLDLVSRGELPFVEEGMDTALETAVASNRLTVSKQVPEADIFILAVPTPFNDDRTVDLAYINAATDSVIPRITDGDLVILESTSPPGTTEHVARRILDARPDLSLDHSDSKGQVHVAHAPERVLPGRIIAELTTNDRVIGGLTDEASELARDAYATFCTGSIHLTDARTAEMSKLAENSFRDVNIAFANELSVICSNLGIDVWELIEMANMHPRVNILRPGPGVGGHCIAVDPWFIASADPANSRLIQMARTVNDNKPEWVLRKVKESLTSADAATSVAILGLAFKPDIDDLRESPAVRITQRLAEDMPRLRILAVEPNITELPTELAKFENIALVDLQAALPDADSIVVLVGHRQFQDIALDLTRDNRVFDTCGLQGMEVLPR